MAFPVSVPGASASTIILQFQSATNANLAQTLANNFWAALAGGSLHVQNESAGPSVPGSLNEYTIGDLGGNPNTGPNVGTVPLGYLGIIDAFDAAHPATVTGAAQLGETVLGQGGLTFNTNSGSGIYLASGGQNVFSGTGVGGDWTVLFDGGNNAVFANSANVDVADNGAVAGTVGAGTNLIFLGSGSDTVTTFGTDTVVGGSGPATVFAASAGDLVFGGTGSMLFVAGSGNNTVVAGGNSTLFGGSGHGLYFEGAGSFLLDVENGSDTVVGAASITSGLSQLFAPNGGAVYLFGDTRNVLIAGPGNVTLNAGGSSGDNVLVGNTGADTLVAGSGTNFLIAGIGGNTTMSGGANVNTFTFINGGAGGNDLIQNWNANDRLLLAGFAPGGITKQKVTGGSDHITLSDGTQITVENFAHKISASNIFTT